MSEKYEVIFFVLNRGHEDEAMAAAREAGARGGTVIMGRGSATPEAVVKALGISVHPEKEILMILTRATERTQIMSAIAKVAGINKPGGGIGFSLPVEDVTGLTSHISEGKEE